MENPSPSAGGIQNMAYWIACELSAKGHDVVVIGDRAKIPAELSGRDNVEVFKWGSIRSKYLSDFYTALLLLKLRAKFGKNVIFYAMLINNLKLLRLMKVFSSWTCVSFLYGNEVLRFISRRPKTFIQNVNFCHRVFVISRYTRDKACSVYPFDNLMLLHPGINPADFVDKEVINLRNESGWNDRKIVLMLSRLVARKGHFVVINAIKRIVEKYPQVLLLIGGTGPYGNQIENQVRLAGLQSHVVFLGFVPENVKVSYFKACDIYCMPSDIDEGAFDVEGFGITFIEAAATGTLAIGSKSGGIPDAIEDGKSGFLIEPHDEAQLADLFDRIFSDPTAYEDMKAYARKRALGEFSWTQQIDQIIAAVNDKMV